MDTIEAENALAEQQEASGDFADSAEGGTSDDPDPSSYESDKPHPHSHKLRAEKYENTQIIWFATNS